MSLWTSRDDGDNCVAATMDAMCGGAVRNGYAEGIADYRARAAFYYARRTRQPGGEAARDSAVAVPMPVPVETQTHAKTARVAAVAAHNVGVSSRREAPSARLGARRHGMMTLDDLSRHREKHLSEFRAAANNQQLYGSDSGSDSDDSGDDDDDDGDGDDADAGAKHLSSILGKRRAPRRRHGGSRHRRRPKKLPRTLTRTIVEHGMTLGSEAKNIESKAVELVRTITITRKSARGDSSAGASSDKSPARKRGRDDVEGASAVSAPSEVPDAKRAKPAEAREETMALYMHAFLLSRNLMSEFDAYAMEQIRRRHQRAAQASSAAATPHSGARARPMPVPVATARPSGKIEMSVDMPPRQQPHPATRPGPFSASNGSISAPVQPLRFSRLQPSWSSESAAAAAAATTTTTTMASSSALAAPRDIGNGTSGVPQSAADEAAWEDVIRRLRAPITRRCRSDEAPWDTVDVFGHKIHRILCPDTSGNTNASSGATSPAYSTRSRKPAVHGELIGIVGEELSALLGADGLNALRAQVDTTSAGAEGDGGGGGGGSDGGTTTTTQVAEPPRLQIDARVFVSMQRAEIGVPSRRETRSRQDETRAIANAPELVPLSLSLTYMRARKSRIITLAQSSHLDLDSGTE